MASVRKNAKKVSSASIETIKSALSIISNTTYVNTYVMFATPNETKINVYCLRWSRLGMKSVWFTVAVTHIHTAFYSKLIHTHFIKATYEI